MKVVFTFFGFLTISAPASKKTAESAGAVEYTGCISAEGQDSPNECPGYVTKQPQSSWLGL